MKSLLSLILSLVVSSAFADTYRLYVAHADPKIFDVKKLIVGSTGILDPGAKRDAIYDKVFSYKSKVTIDLLIEVDGASSIGENRTYKMDYIAELDEAQMPKTMASKEVGTKFKASEVGDKVSFDFIHTWLENWVPLSYPARIGGPFLTPMFSSLEFNTSIELKKGQALIMYGLERDVPAGNKFTKSCSFFIIERR